MTTPTDAPAHSVAHVTGRTGAVSVEPSLSSHGGYDVRAGTVRMRGVPTSALSTFGRDVLDHLTTRSGERVSVRWEDPFPASAVLTDGGVQLRLLDDGHLHLMAFEGAAKGGTGTGATLEGVRAFARALAGLT